MSNGTPDQTTAFAEMIATALAEDIGPGDITSELLIPKEAQARMNLVAREPMVACGLFLVDMVYRQLDPSVQVDVKAKEGQPVAKDTILVSVSGPGRTLLTGERVTLNLLQRACGVATLTRRYVEAVKGTRAVILDTRKTMPGLRALDKYAVKAGGGQNYRMGLYDAVMIKDNHIALSGGLAQAVAKARRGAKSASLIVECDTITQVEEALAAKPDRILLDNMNLASLRQAVTLAAGNVPLEASGGVSLEIVRDIAETGVDYISIGKLTHSAPAADIGADITT